MNLTTPAGRPRPAPALVSLGFAVFAASAVPVAAETAYFPPAGSWARKAPAEVGMDAAALDAAIRFAREHETDWLRDFSTQNRIFGTPLGPVPGRRAGVNGLVIRRGYVVAEFGDTHNVAPTYSVAKSFLSTVAAVARRDGVIPDLDAPVGSAVKDGGYDSPQNAPVTWRMHLRQESEWEGEMWGKTDDFVGAEAFGEGERKPRERKPPGTFYEYNDVRINRLSLSLLRVLKKPVPDVFRDEVGDPIGMSHTWMWLPYRDSYVEIDGRVLPSVSGGTRWGGGVWIDAWDLARFGLLWRNGGSWAGRRIVPPDYVRDALTPGSHGPDYGLLFWLNTKGENYPGLPPDAFGARGAGSNSVVISPAHDLVVVWRWHAGNAAEFVRRVIAAVR